MKTLLIAIMVFALSAFSTDVKANAEAALSGICDTVAADNKVRFRKKLKDSGLRLRNIYDGIQCGDLTLIQYAMSKGADNVGTFMVSRMPASHFDKSGELAWADQNGFGETLITKAIIER